MRKIILLLTLVCGVLGHSQDLIMQNGTFNQCSGTFYDSGGASGNYSSNENYVITICPENPGDYVQLDFTQFSVQFSVPPIRDYLIIYDGDSTAEPLLNGVPYYLGGAATGPQTVNASLSNPTGCLTIEFVSDATGNGPGWAADISCLPGCQDITPSILTDPAPGGDGIVEIPFGGTVDFEGSAVFSEDDTGATYSWNFQDPPTATGQNVSHTFDDWGLYTVTLTVSDDNPLGCSGATTIQVRVLAPYIDVMPNEYTVEELVEDVLIDSACANISNITSAGNAGISYFHKSGAIFPFQDGVVLNSGPAEDAEGPVTDNSGGGWAGDAQLFNYIQSLGIDPDLNSYNDATWIAFDFVPIVDNFSFNFLFASMEYGTYQCSFSDAFAFFLTDLSTNTTTNIALVPGTTTPISVITIRDDAHNTGCPSVNEEYFETFYGATGEDPTTAPINYRGVVKALTASATVVPNNTYRIKLVVADRNDSILNSAVFLEAGSFNLGGNLGPDLTIDAGNTVCSNEPIILNTEVTGLNHTWYFNGEVIPGENGPILTVTEGGTYDVEIGDGGSCAASDTIFIEFYPDPVIEDIENLYICNQGTPPYEFDLTSNEALILGTQDNADEFVITYHNSQAQADADGVAIAAPDAYSGTDGEVVYVRIDFPDSPCYETTSFTLNIIPQPQINPVPDLELCDELGDGVEEFDLESQTAGILDTQALADFTVTYYDNFADADAGTNELTSPYPNTSEPQPIWVRIELNNDEGCYNVSTDPLFNLVLIPMDDASFVIEPVCGGATVTSVATPSGTFAFNPVPTDTAAIDPATGTITGGVQGATYTVEYTTNGPCPFTESNSVTILEADDSSFTLTATCGGATATVTGDQGGSFAFSPDPMDGAVLDTATGTITSGQPGATYTVEYTTNVSCPTTSSQSVTVLPMEFATFTMTATCDGGTASITGDANGTFAFNPNPADGAVIDTTSGAVTNGQPGTTYTVSYTTSGPCPATESIDVTVLPAEDPSFTFVSDCTGATMNVTGDLNGTFSFDPAPTDGAVIDSNTGEITNGTPGATYTVSYTTVGPCPATLEQMVSILPSDDSSFTLTATCDGATATVTGDLGGSFAFSPDPMDGAVLDTSSGAITNGQPGATYTVEYTTSGLCYTSTTQSVTVFPLEDASFTLTANCTGATATVTGDANGTFALSPDPGDGAVIDPVTGTLSNAVSGATYTVSYTTSGPCPETTSQSVTVPNQDDATFTMTPNCSGATANISGTTGGTFAFNPVPNDGAVIDPVTGEITNAPSGATYTVEYTTVGTCADSSTVQVSVLITDDPSFVMSPTCDGATVASTATPGGTFSFDVPPTDTAVIDTGTGTISGGTPGATYSVGYVTNGTCPSSSVVQVTAHSLPVVVAPTDLIVCDDNVPDGVVELDLTVKDGEITGNNANYVVTYHPDQASADLGTPEVLPSADAYVGTDGEVVYVRVEHVSTGCYDTTTLTLQVVGAPAANAPAPLTYCDPDNDGLGTFDLASTVAGITGGDPALDVTFHLTQQNAEDDVLPQASPLSNVLGQVIFVRVDYANASTDCPTVLQLQLIVNPTPEIEESPSPLELCDEDGTSDGFTEFDLTASETEILNGLSAADHTVTYYVDPADAAVGPTATSYIAAPGAFTNTMPFQQTIGVRVEDNTTGCHSTALLDLEVHLLPEPVTTTEALQLNICDDSLDNDGYAVFDLTVQNGLITANESGLSVSYYETQLEAQDDQPIADPTAYANTSVNGQPHNPQTLYVRVTDNDTGCYDFSTLTLVVDPVPTPTPSDQLDALEQCDSATPGDMVELFDLTANETDILNGETGVTPTYHETLEDAEAGTPMIADPTAYANLSDTQTIYVRVTNDSTGCYTIVDFDIVVHPLPAVVAVTDYEVCEVQTDGVYGFDLESKTEEVLNGQDPNIFVVTYHDSQGDADLGTDDLISLYSNTSNPQTIYVRIENTLTGCSISTPTFEIQVFDGAEANADAVPIEYVQCDDNMETDGDPTNDSVQFDLTTLDAEVLDGQDPAVFTVSYYATLADADAGTDQLPTLYENTVNPQTVYVRVDNDGTPDNFCYALSEVTLMVDPLPVFDLADSYVLCLDTNGTEVVGPTVLDTGLDTSGYSFEWTQDGTVLAGATEGSYEPTVGGIYGVTVTDLATGCSHMDSTVVEESTPPVLTAEVLTQAFADTHVVEAVATGSGVSTFEYSLDNGPWQESGTFVDVPAGEHTITARDVNGCGTATVTLMVMDYPVFFTPNGDGYHDTWNIYGISSQANAKIYIFDRYGKLLKQLSPTGDGWDGSYNGEPLPSSDYWFTVEYNEPSSGSRKEFKAHFTLKR